MFMVKPHSHYNEPIDACKSFIFINGSCGQWWKWIVELVKWVLIVQVNGNVGFGAILNGSILIFGFLLCF